MNYINQLLRLDGYIAQREQEIAPDEVDDERVILAAERFEANN